MSVRYVRVAQCIMCTIMCVISVRCSVSAYDLLWCGRHQFVMQCLYVFCCDVCVIRVWCSVYMYYSICVIRMWCSVSAYDLLWRVCHQSVMQCRHVFSVMRVSSECGTVSLAMIYFDVCIISLRCSIAVFFLRCVCRQSVIRCLWHPKLNQMALGCGDGRVHLYYDPKKSHRLVGSAIWLQLMQNEIFKYSTQEYWFYSQQG